MVTSSFVTECAREEIEVGKAHCCENRGASSPVHGDWSLSGRYEEPAEGYPV